MSIYPTSTRALRQMRTSGLQAMMPEGPAVVRWQHWHLDIQSRSRGLFHAWSGCWHAVGGDTEIYAPNGGTNGVGLTTGPQSNCRDIVYVNSGVCPKAQSHRYPYCQ